MLQSHICFNLNVFLKCLKNGHVLSNMVATGKLITHIKKAIEFRGKMWLKYFASKILADVIIFHKFPNSLFLRTSQEMDGLLDWDLNNECVFHQFLGCTIFSLFNVSKIRTWSTTLCTFHLVFMVPSTPRSC